MSAKSKVTDIPAAQLKGLPSGKSEFFNYNAMQTTKPMEKKQALLAGTFNIYQDEALLG